MKKVLLTIVGMLAVWAVAASAAPNYPPKVTPQQGATATQAGGAVQDKRIITPQMNARERFETQRAIQKRAAANRNKLMLQAAEEEKRAKAATQSGHPVDSKVK